MKTLIFKESGWCEELKMSYKRGPYTPKTQQEYITLAKYAANVAEDDLKQPQEQQPYQEQEKARGPRRKKEAEL